MGTIIGMRALERIFSRKRTGEVAIPIKVGPPTNETPPGRGVFLHNPLASIGAFFSRFTAFSSLIWYTERRAVRVWLLRRLRFSILLREEQLRLVLPGSRIGTCRTPRGRNISTWKRTRRITSKICF